MRVRCNHGFFIFEETTVGQVSDFISLTGLNIVPFAKDYTFADLITAPKYSLAGHDLLGFTAIKTFEGEPWEVFKSNGVVYDFSMGKVVPITSITIKTSVDLAGNRYVSPGLIIPGSVTADGKRVKDYSAWFSRHTLRFLYSEVAFV